MGYDLHITRAENWADNSGAEISAQEWLSLVKNDPELIPAPENGPGFVSWGGSTRYAETWFDWQNGEIFTNNPDRATLIKMGQMAQKLAARVQGDEGEIYGAEEIENFVDPVLENNPQSLNPAKQQPGILARIKRWLRNL